MPHLPKLVTSSAASTPTDVHPRLAIQAIAAPASVNLAAIAPIDRIPTEESPPVRPQQAPVKKPRGAVYWVLVGWWWEPIKLVWRLLNVLG